ncbi:hypothetical protein [Polaribacter sp. IC073]|uniref:hypothetical protein n=1 Tax=Polaribacter sp. IC073 TaxID=2508540 RepID=UPI0011BD92EE|nr:hypothetical protein [Polaribacter sp. IC073]TXD49762.1 hypothetical protein ES045_00835 [Polaribacter sp. IC073]
MKLILTLILFSLFHVNCISQISKKIIIPKNLLNQMNEMFANDQKYRTYISKNRSNLKKFKKDSLWKLQNVIDTYNTKRLIVIIKQYGYFDSGNSNSNIAIYAMLMHTPDELKKEVTDLINIEYEKGKIDEASYGMITWHLEGRPKPIINFKKTD